MTSAAALRIKAFNEVQALEYRFDIRDPARDLSCRGKTGRLAGKLRELGLSAQETCCRFYWVDTGLPSELIALAPGPELQHWFVSMAHPETGQTRVIDPTYNPALKRVGFTVAEWDGNNSTPLAVKPFYTFSAKDSARIWAAAQEIPQSNRDEFESICGPFYDKLNQWIASARLKGLHA